MRRVDGAEIRHKRGDSPHCETAMAPGHTVRLLIKPAQDMNHSLKTVAGPGIQVGLLIQAANPQHMAWVIYLFIESLQHCQLHRVISGLLASINSHVNSQTQVIATPV